MISNGDIPAFFIPMVTKVFKKLARHIKASDYFFDFFGSDTQVDDSVLLQKELFIRCLSLPYQDVQEQYAIFAKTLYVKNITLVDMVETHNYIRRKLYQELVRQEMLECHFFKLNELFLHIRRGIAQGYLFEEVHLQREFYKKEFDQTLFYRVHIKWMLDLMDTIENPYHTKSTQFDVSQCSFTQLLDMPITEMILKSEADKHFLVQTTQKLYTQARNLLSYINKKHYYEAHIHFNSIVNQSIRIMHFLNKKIIHHYGSVEESFTHYVQYQNEKGIKGYLSCFNIAKLKLINKYKGDDIGDRLISHVEQSLKAFFVALDEDVVFIRGKNGDFLIFFPNITKTYLQTLQDRLRSLIESQGLLIQGETLYAKLYIGTLPLHTEGIFKHLEKMLTYVINQAKESDEKIFYAKREEEAQTIEFIEKSRQDINFVEHALNDEKLEIFFQPIIDLQTGLLFDVEVLARIKHGQHFITAGAFINLIYELDIIVDLDIGILRKVVTYADELIKVTANVFINVSPSSLKSQRYRDILTHSVTYLRDKGLQPYFELTEEALLSNIELLEDIHAKHNITFAVDDFGTGYSSLKTVADLAEKKVIAFIKIDGSIIRHILNSEETLNILDATNYMTKKLKLKNVAEFIENEKILEKVKEIGIHYGQGHYFSQALSMKELQAKYLD